MRELPDQVDFLERSSDGRTRRGQREGEEEPPWPKAPTKRVRPAKQVMAALLPVRLVRLSHNGKDWDLNRGGDTQMLNEYRKRRLQSPVAKRSHYVTTRELKHKMRRWPPFSLRLHRKNVNREPPVFLYVTGRKSFSVDAKEAAVLREYLARWGGTILGDSPGGEFPRSFVEMVSAVLGGPARWVSVPADDDVFRTPYNLTGNPPLYHHDGFVMKGIGRGGRWVVLWHPGQMNRVWKVGHSGCSPETAEAAYQLGVNLIHYCSVQLADFHRLPTGSRAFEKRGGT